MYADPFRAAIPRASALRSAMAKLINYSDLDNKIVVDFELYFGELFLNKSLYLIRK